MSNSYFENWSWRDRVGLWLRTSLFFGAAIFVNYGTWMTSAQALRTFPLNVLSSISNWLLLAPDALFGFAIGLASYTMCEHFWKLVRLKKFLTTVSILSMFLLNIPLLNLADRLMNLFNNGARGGWIALIFVQIAIAQPILYHFRPLWTTYPKTLCRGAWAGTKWLFRSAPRHTRSLFHSGRHVPSATTQLWRSEQAPRTTTRSHRSTMRRGSSIHQSGDESHLGYPVREGGAVTQYQPRQRPVYPACDELPATSL